MAEIEITKIDQTTYEFLKSKLASDIGSDVKASLFRQYWVWLTGFSAGVAVLGFVSFAKLIPDLVQSVAERYVQRETADVVKNARAGLDNLNSLVADRRKELDQNAATSESVKQALANMKRYSEDTEQDLRVVRSRASDNKKSVEDLRAQVIESIKKDLVTIPDFQAASNRIADIVAELLKIKEDIRQMQTQGQTPPAQTQQESARVEALQRYVGRERQRVTVRSATVFIQFASVPRDVIKSFASGLKDMGWTVPPEEQVDGAAQTKEVRFYYEEDRAKAAQLIEDISEQIRLAGYAAVEFEAKALLSYPKKPKPGTLEVWVGVIPRKS